jgi:hypothetical protein
MSDFEKEVPLAMAKRWEQTDGLNNPVAVSNKGFKQPDRVNIRRPSEVIGAREQTAKVVPDQAEQGIEWAIVYTIPQFVSSIVNGWKLNTTATLQKEIFTHFMKCLQGKATSLWKAVVAEHAPNPDLHDWELWCKCVVFYFEKMAGMKFIGDHIIHQVLTWKRPIVVSFNDYVDRSTLLLSYITEGQIRTVTPMPNDQQLMNAYFRNQPKSMRATYTLRELRPEGTMEVFKNAMTAIEDTAKNTESYKNAMQVYRLSASRATALKKGDTPRPTKPRAGQAHRRSEYQKSDTQRGDHRRQRYSDRDRDRGRPRNDRYDNSRSAGRGRGRDRDRDRDHNRGQGKRPSYGDRGKSSRARESHALDRHSRSRSRERSQRRSRSPSHQRRSHRSRSSSRSRSHSRDSRSRSPPARSHRKSGEAHGIDDDIYENHDESYAVQPAPFEASSSSEEDKAPKGSLRMPAHSKYCRKSNKHRVEFLKKKRQSEEQQARKDRQLQSTCQAGYQEYLKQDNDPREELSLTKWSVKHGKFKAPKFDKEPRFLNEKNRLPCALDEQGCIVGTGNFYKRPYGAYTWEELMATQEKTMRVRTQDLLIPDQIRREITGDDSGDDSDWLNRTGHPLFYIAPLAKHKEPNRSSFTIVIKGKQVQLPFAFAKDPVRRTKVQKKSAEEQEKKPAAKSK